MISMGLPHKATPLTGAMCLAAASRIKGTIAHAAANPEAYTGTSFGSAILRCLNVTASCEQREGSWHVGQVGVFRTARRLFDGRVLMPVGKTA